MLCALTACPGSDLGHIHKRLNIPYADATDCSCHKSSHQTSPSRVKDLNEVFVVWTLPVHCPGESLSNSLRKDNKSDMFSLYRTLARIDILYQSRFYRCCITSGLVYAVLFPHPTTFTAPTEETILRCVAVPARSLCHHRFRYRVSDLAQIRDLFLPKVGKPAKTAKIVRYFEEPLWASIYHCLVRFLGFRPLEKSQFLYPNPKEKFETNFFLTQLTNFQ